MGNKAKSRAGVRDYLRSGRGWLERMLIPMLANGPLTDGTL